MTFIVVINFYEKVRLISILKSPVYWDKLGNNISMQLQTWVTSVDITNLHGLYHTLGIPVSGGLGLGFLTGFVRSR
ncbi:MAG: hypothetical protein WBF33_33270 [Candidatus Nitrosopolaris sp.]|jgi:hypothetical protein